MIFTNGTSHLTKVIENSVAQEHQWILHGTLVSTTKNNTYLIVEHHMEIIKKVIRTYRFILFVSKTIIIVMRMCSMHIIITKIWNIIIIALRTIAKEKNTIVRSTELYKNDNIIKWKVERMKRRLFTFARIKCLFKNKRMFVMCSRTHRILSLLSCLWISTNNKKNTNEQFTEQQLSNS